LERRALRGLKGGASRISGTRNALRTAGSPSGGGDVSVNMLAEVEPTHPLSSSAAKLDVVTTLARKLRLDDVE